MDFRIYTVTYNVATLFPKASENLDSLLGFSEFGNGFEWPDMYVVGFQEINSQPQNVFRDIFYDDPWVALFKRALSRRGYICVRCERLLGTLLTVFALKRHLCQIRRLQASFVRVGLAGYWGNKGAVALRMSLYGVNMCVVNAHLAAHDHMLEKRVENFNDIMEQVRFEDSRYSKLLYFDYVIWLGDLNFRIAPSCDDSADNGSLSDADVARLCGDRQLVPLLRRDELGSAQAAGLAFTEFTEPDITFHPTYKMLPDVKDVYDASRRPAWTDRILFYVHEHMQRERSLRVEPRGYRSHPDSVTSDHRPVSVSLTIQVVSGETVPCVEFLPVARWYIGDDCVAKFRTDRGLHLSSWDWVALYKSDFSGLGEYVTYVWAPRVPSSPNSDHYVVSFPEDCITFPGEYVLVYFGGGGMGVYGISHSFSVRYRR